MAFDATTKETAEELLKVTEHIVADNQTTAVSDLVRSFNIWAKFKRVISPDGFAVHQVYVTARRRAVAELIKSHTYQDVANKLGIDIEDVKNDVRVINAPKSKKV